MNLQQTVRTRIFIDLYRGINYYKRGYQPTTKLVNDRTGDLLADSHIVLNRWKNYFSQLLNVHRVSDVYFVLIYRKVATFRGYNEYNV
jgi:hypothetical protein